MADFTIAVNLTLVNEGGYENNPDDSGNWTGGKVWRGRTEGHEIRHQCRGIPHS